jgi:hypothetical protein
MHRAVAIAVVLGGCRDDPAPRPVHDYALAEGTAHRSGATLDELFCGTIRGADGDVVGWMATFTNKGGAFAAIYAPGFRGDGKYKARYTSAGNRSVVEVSGAYDVVLDDGGRHGWVLGSETLLELRCFDGDDTHARETPAPVLPTRPGTAWAIDEYGGLFMFEGVSCLTSASGLAVVTEGGPSLLALELPAMSGAGSYTPTAAAWSFHAAGDRYDASNHDTATVTLTATTPRAGTFRIGHNARETHGGFTCPSAI